MRLLLAGCATLALASPAFAQDDNAMPAMNMSPNGDGSMPAMNMGSADHAAGDSEFICTGGLQLAPYADGSGTSRLPGYEGMGSDICSAMPPMRMQGGIHLMTGGWMVMLHGYLSAQYTDFSGPRGDDKLYSTSMFMLTGERQTDWGRIELKSMFSLEPTMAEDGYPSLFTTGETAHGAPLVDRQHPHDLFMELAARVDVNIAPGTSVFLYGGPVGEPALGPSAFMHRRSAENNPEPPITHHWFDSTHITYGVVTAGFSNHLWQLEASAFRGAEPDENRWNIETPKLDSWSVRATLNPSHNWALQASYGELHQPEAAHPGEDEHRFTMSANYANTHGLSAMLAFSAKDRVPGRTLTAWLGEANWDFSKHDSLFGRVENVANDELFPAETDALHDVPFRVTKFEAGYARHFTLAGPLSLTLGASGSAYAKPSALDPYYGDSPLGYTLFAKVSLGH
jgi:hypothetical protein